MGAFAFLSAEPFGEWQIGLSNFMGVVTNVLMHITTSILMYDSQIYSQLTRTIEVSKYVL